MSSVFTLSFLLGFSLAAANTTAENQEQIDRHFGLHSISGFPSSNEKVEKVTESTGNLLQTKSKAAKQTPKEKPAVAVVPGGELIGGIAKSLEPLSDKKNPNRQILTRNENPSKAAAQPMSSITRSTKEEPTSRLHQQTESKASNVKQKVGSKQQTPYLVTSAFFHAAAVPLLLGPAVLIARNQRFIYPTSNSPPIDTQPLVVGSLAAGAISAVVGTVALISTPRHKAE